MFHLFSSQEERRIFGGSYFIELQYCRLEEGSEIKKIILMNAIKHWKNDSLYIYGNDDSKFVCYYEKIYGLVQERKE